MPALKEVVFDDDVDYDDDDNDNDDNNDDDDNTSTTTITMILMMLLHCRLILTSGIELVGVGKRYVLSLYWATATATSTG